MSNCSSTRAYKIYPEEAAAIKLAEEQHKPGNYVKLINFKVTYFYANGSVVPEYDYFLKKEYERR